MGLGKTEDNGIMGKNNSDEFMLQMLKEEAWKYLSEDIEWTDTLLEKYADKVDWKEISDNRNIFWTVPMLQKFSKKVDWKVLSGHADRVWFTSAHLEAFKDKWDWNEVVSKFPLSDAMIVKYADYVDWAALIGADRRYGMPHKSNFDAIAFFETYKELIPMTKLRDSDLWRRMVIQTAKQLFKELVS